MTTRKCAAPLMDFALISCPRSSTLLGIHKTRYCNVSAMSFMARETPNWRARGRSDVQGFL
jgi:hypothetical protein